MVMGDVEVVGVMGDWGSLAKWFHHSGYTTGKLNRYIYKTLVDGDYPLVY